MLRGVEQPGRAAPERRRRRRRAGAGGAHRRGHLRGAAPGARADGADELPGRRPRGPRRGLGADAGPRRRAGAGRRGHRARAQDDHRAHDARGRRVRPPADVGLRRRGGLPLQGDGPAGAGRVDPGGGFQPGLLPALRRAPAARGARRGRPGHGWDHHLANPSRYAYAKNDRPPVSSEMYADDFPVGCLPNVRLAYTPRGQRHPAVARGAPRSTPRTPSRSRASWTSWRTRSAATRWSSGSSCWARRGALEYKGHGGPVFDTGRLAGVLRLAAERAGWSTPLPAGRARGIAGHFTFGSYAAHVVEVSRAAERRPGGSDRRGGRLRPGGEPERRRGPGAGRGVRWTRRRAPRRDHRGARPRTRRPTSTATGCSGSTRRRGSRSISCRARRLLPDSASRRFRRSRPPLANAVFALTGKRSAAADGGALSSRKDGDDERRRDGSAARRGLGPPSCPLSVLSVSPSLYSPSLIRSTRRDCVRAL